MVEAVTGDGTVRVGDSQPVTAQARLDARRVLVETGGTAARYAYATDDMAVWLGRGGDAWKLTRRRDRIDRAGPAELGTGPLTSPMPGTVLAVYVSPGEAVRAGQPVVAVEAMKMEHVVAAPHDGTVSELLVNPGDSVRLDQPLAVIAAAGADR